MKSTLSILSLSVLTFISTSSFAAAQKLECKNEAHSAITFSLSIDQDKASLAFGQSGNQSELEKDLVGKKLNLVLNPEASARGWLEYDGAILVNKYYHESRDVQIRVAQSELEKTTDIRVVMAPSDTYPDNLGGIVFHQYGMKCVVK